MRRLILSCALIILAASSVLALEIGQSAAALGAKTFDGRNLNLGSYHGKIVVLEWFNPGCPFVKKHYQNGDMPRLQQELTAKEIVWLTVVSTHGGHQDAITPERWREVKNEFHVASTEALDDHRGELGKAFGAKTTPHLFVLDSQGRLAYKGAIDDDDTLRGKPAEAKNYMRAAVESLLAGQPVATPETKSYGCSVKYE